MKFKAVLLGSLCLNVALFAGFWLKRPAVAESTAVSETDAADAKALKPVKDAERLKTELKVVTTTNDFDWASVESEDYREYINNLRGIGCPEDTVRDIIIADINKLYASRIAALYPGPADFKFWRVEDRAARSEERERDEKRRDLEREKRDLIKELLGVDYEAELARASGRPDEDSWRYGFLSAEKQALVRALNDKYREQERALFGNGGWSAENRAKYAAMRTQREAELAQILGPEEFQQYLLRNSWTARNMRENLASFQPNEEEFRKLFDLRKAYDDQFGYTRDGGDDAMREQRRIAQQNLEDQMRALLGEDRFRQYQMAQDERFRDIYEFTERNSLPRQTAEVVYDMRRAAEDARRQLQAQANLDEAARQAALAQLADETRRTLMQTLGEANWDEYRRRDGRWIDRLAQTEDSRDGGGDRDRYRRN
jgi:hypothetical protein